MNDHLRMGSVVGALSVWNWVTEARQLTTKMRRLRSDLERQLSLEPAVRSVRSRQIAMRPSTGS